MTNSWGKSNQLSRGCSKYSHSQHNHGQTRHQQQDNHTTGEVHVWRHKKLLCGHLHGQIWMHVIATHFNPGWIHCSVWPALYDTQRPPLHENMMRHIWPPKSWDTRQSTPSKKIGVTRLQTMPKHPWPLSTPMARTHSLLACHGRLWN